MTAFVVLALAIPIMGAGALAVTSLPMRRVVEATGGLGAAAWLAVAVSTEPVTAGRLEVDAVVACALAAMLGLVAVDPPATAASGTVLLSLATLLAVGVADAGGSTALFAGAVVALVVPGALDARTAVPRPARPALAALVAVLAMTALGASGHDDGALVFTVAALAAASVLALGVVPPGSAHLVPVVLLVVVVTRAPADDPEAVAIAGLVVGVVVTAGLALRLALARRSELRLDLTGSAAIGATLVLATVDIPDAASAALLVAAGAVLVVAARHRWSVVALLPGVAASITVLSRATEPRHAAAGAVVVLLALVATTSDGADDATWALAPAIVFGLVPLWGWAGADLPAYRDGVVVAATAALVGATAWAIPQVRAASPAEVTAAPVPDTGSITPRRVRRPAFSHGDKDLQEDAVEER